MHWDDILAVSFLVTIGVSAFAALGFSVWLSTSEPNTVTIHKQDRVSLPCPDQGEGK